MVKHVFLVCVVLVLLSGCNGNGVPVDYYDGNDAETTAPAEEVYEPIPTLQPTITPSPFPVFSVLFVYLRHW